MFQVHTGRGDSIQRIQFHEYKAGFLPLSLSFQILFPCGMRHLVHTEPSKKNGGDRLCLVTFCPILQSWPAHCSSATGQASMPVKYLWGWYSSCPLLWLAHKGLSPLCSLVSAESPWQGWWWPHNLTPASAGKFWKEELGARHSSGALHPIQFLILAAVSPVANFLYLVQLFAAKSMQRM